MLLEAQRTLATDPQQALSILRRATAQHGDAGLVQEREALAIDALVRLGKRREAEARAQRFFARYPTSSYARRVRQILERAQ